MSVMKTNDSVDTFRKAVIVTALPVEYNAIRSHLIEVEEEEHVQGDVYEHGKFENNGQIWDVGIVEIGAGNPNAAAKTERAIAHFHPSVTIFVGVAGGIKDVTVGDIVVATKVYGYHSGKAAEEFQTRPAVSLPHHRILERARAEARKNDWLYRIKSHDTPKARVFLGAIAAGEEVVVSKQSVSYKLIRSHYSDALAVEMESYGFLRAAQAYSDLEALVVRGISDLLENKTTSDEHGGQELASRHAAAFAFEVLSKVYLKRSANKPRVEPILPLAIAPSAPRLSLLPTQSHFFGREQELLTIKEALAPQSRTWGVLIDGPGGIGKTALAIRAAHDAPESDFHFKLFVSAKVRELAPSGEQPLNDFCLPSYQDIIKEIASQIGADVSKIDPNERTRVVQRLLSDKSALIVVDNVETLPDVERSRLYQFLARLPVPCKGIVTGRRRSDVAAQVVRLDRLPVQDVMCLLEALSKTNRILERSTRREWTSIYETTQGNPLLVCWLVGQLGRPESRCKTVSDACNFLIKAPKQNDPLDYIFGDLIDSFTPNELTALSALSHFSYPVPALSISRMTDTSEASVQVALEDLSDRALVVGDERCENFLLPTLVSTFLKKRCPDLVLMTATRLTDHVLSLATENGYRNYDKFPVLSYSWAEIDAALPGFLSGSNEQLQTLCAALFYYLDFCGRWDEQLIIQEAAEKRAIATGDLNNAGWRAFATGVVYIRRDQWREALACADRCSAHWEQANAGAYEKAHAARLRGLAHQSAKNFGAAIDVFREVLRYRQSLGTESIELAIAWNDLAEAERYSKKFDSAEEHYRVALDVAHRVKHELGVVIYTGNLAELAHDRSDWKTAESLATEALRLSERIGRDELIGGNCYILAISLLRQLQPIPALPFAQRSVGIFSRLRQPTDLSKAQEALRECLEAKSGRKILSDSEV